MGCAWLGATAPEELELLELLEELELELLLDELEDVASSPEPLEDPPPLPPQPAMTTAERTNPACKYRALILLISPLSFL